MQITNYNNITSSSSGYTDKDTSYSSSSFINQLEELNNQSNDSISYYKTRDEINEENEALQQFKKDLTTKGATKFLYDFNMEKIEKMVEEYKEKLLKELKDNPNQDVDVEKMVSEYKKDLLKKLAELNDKENNSPLNVNRLQFEITDAINPSFKKALELV
jgi:NADH dehydrogenase/NADH:ubiquinone oxidoreductase subunit G